jgi:hypothetical protein
VKIQNVALLNIVGAAAARRWIYDEKAGGVSREAIYVNGTRQRLIVFLGREVLMVKGDNAM